MLPLVASGMVLGSMDWQMARWVKLVMAKVRKKLGCILTLMILTVMNAFV